MTTVTILPDGRVIAKNTVAATSRTNAGALPVSVTIPDLRSVEYVLQFNLNTSPQTNATPTGIKITKNIVGATIYVGAGTTISGEVIAIGF